MTEALENEIAAINAIYGPGTLVTADSSHVYILALATAPASLRIYFPPTYPEVAPNVLGSHGVGAEARKGEAAEIVMRFRQAIQRLHQVNEVCLFDVVEDVLEGIRSRQPSPFQCDELVAPANSNQGIEATSGMPTPSWSVSDVMRELKSVFIARCTRVNSPQMAQAFVQHLVDHEKKVQAATHNITAWRIRRDATVTYQDYDDDGETAAGARLLHLLQRMDVWNVMVVVSRWYGGHHLGPRRFTLINAVARDALVKANIVTTPKSKP
ncbi:BgTH12-07450 [Blumeria graminis f. sp. triticale]|uniref:Bgt-2596 n=3 Tax=Blumeria graminis TaxID=34373 RepID=A0A9X9L9Z1_BLUGR|nr:hypothetical protein BGT96224_2596 [Blumeria graminis f. sp. tritici 96224]CAD6500270.1 BgTH12-07450 [Blumeria graminis f. sp. triticale]VCU40518.1 Bgt-2596 [Blumeria graminis f. sp. tritici]